MQTYSGNAEDGILDITLKLIDRDEPEQLHAVIICKYDWRREQFSICMLENFISDEDTDLTGNVLIIALIYATTFCQIAELDDVYIQDPNRVTGVTDLPRYGMTTVRCLLMCATSSIPYDAK